MWPSARSPIAPARRLRPAHKVADGRRPKRLRVFSRRAANQPMRKASELIKPSSHDRKRSYFTGYQPLQLARYCLVSKQRRICSRRSNWHRQPCPTGKRGTPLPRSFTITKRTGPRSSISATTKTQRDAPSGRVSARIDSAQAARITSARR